MCECKYCGKLFERTHASQKYCSSECATNANRERTRMYHKEHYKPKEREKVCPYCGKTFLQTGGFRKYCSKECSSAISERTSPTVKEPKKRTRKKTNSLREMAREARKHGMTYGQYVAQMEMQKGV